MKNLQRAVYECKDYNGRKNLLFYMNSEDFRFRNKDNYVLITSGKVENTTSDYKGRKVRILLGQDGKTYRIFSDNSITEVT